MNAAAGHGDDLVLAFTRGDDQELAPAGDALVDFNASVSHDVPSLAVDVEAIALCKVLPETFGNEAAANCQHPTGDEEADRERNRGDSQRVYAGGDAPPYEELGGVDMGEDTHHRSARGCHDVDEARALSLRQELTRAVNHGVTEEEPGDEGQDGVGQDFVFRKELGESFDPFAADQQTDGVEQHEQDENRRQQSRDVADQTCTAGGKYRRERLSKTNHEEYLPCLFYYAGCCLFFARIRSAASCRTVSTAGKKFLPRLILKN
ncbi:hypothetical protein SDC9_67576 [bioreactor metagenome]|uniref:Uncharacterized protein n=1 Tax=bioreactor metagenome TaxID=1076179 RepID=A0A644Y3N1_9ZZZZ